MKCKGYMLKSLTKALGLTQKDISDRIGINAENVRRCLGPNGDTLPNVTVVVKGVLYETLALSDDFTNIFNDFRKLYDDSSDYDFSESYNSKARREQSRKILDNIDISKYHYVGVAKGRKRRKKAEL